MKYLFALIVWAMLSSCGSGSGNGGSNSNQAGFGTFNAGAYSGVGIGFWRYDNTSDTAKKIDINIQGVTAGNVATLVFSNGSKGVTNLPLSGALNVAASPPKVLADSGFFMSGLTHQKSAHQNDDTHAHMLEKNWEVSAGLIRARPVISPSADLAGFPMAMVKPLSFPPAMGASRSWIDNFLGTPVRYNAMVEAVCPLPNGRHVVWWVDPSIVASGIFSQEEWAIEFSRLKNAYCGRDEEDGGLAQLNTLLGDVWGVAASSYPNSIQDVPFLQDVNVVLLNVPVSSKWAGYFFGGNNLRKTSSSNSNEALALFINASQMKADLNFSISTLLHESTHMVNFYQRSIVKGVVHDTWLEETSAMMTEDIIAPAVLNGYNKVLSYRLPIYASSGGNVSYINWPTLADASIHYAMGGGFGAFLNRRYGLSIYQQLVTGCNEEVVDSPALTSYACLDGLIKANGGIGFSDEFARFGATVFGQLPAVGMLAGYGYPAKQAGRYQLQAGDMSLLVPESASTLTLASASASGYGATFHVFQRDVISVGKTTYVRSGVVVPANTSLMVVIQ